VNSASDSVKDPMDRYHREPTLAEVLSDPVSLAVMDADGVDRYDLAATLSQMAAKLMRPPGPVEKKKRLADSAIAKAVITDRKPDVAAELSESMTRGYNARMLRSNVRVISALVLLAFVVCHLTAHAFLLVSFARADAALDMLMSPWRTAIGTAILVSALLAHYLNGLWSIYVRRYLRLSRWERWQLGLGLCIPLLLMLHVTSTRVAESLLGVSSHYSSVLIVQWLLSPWLAVLQATAVLTVWIHACIGVHFWLRTKPWCPLAAVVCRAGHAAADVGALRLCRSGQSGVTRC